MLPVGSGAMMGQKVVEFVHDWAGVDAHLAGLCFDTTPSNTSIHTGAITVVSQSLKCQLLFLACWYRFARLKSQWHFIDQSKFDPLDSDEVGDGCLNSSEKAWLASRQAAVISNLQQHLEDVQPCEDYREFAQLTLQLLAEKLAPAFLHLGLITEQGGWQKAFTASKYLHFAISLYSANTS